MVGNVLNLPAKRTWTKYKWGKEKLSLSFLWKRVREIGR
jgi:hypothetical protein